MLIGSVLLGLLAGLAARGDLRRLGMLRARWPQLFLAAVVLRLAAVTVLEGDPQRAGYVVALWLLAAVAVANLVLPGAALIGVGIGLNALVIALNGGAMPVSPSALAAAGATMPAGALHQAMDEGTRLWFLADVIPLAAVAGVYSVGDVLLAAGAFWLVFRTLTRPPSGRPPT